MKRTVVGLVLALGVAIGLSAEGKLDLVSGSNYYTSLPLISETAWDSITEAGWLYIQRTATKPSQIVADSTAPLSPGHVLQINFAGTQGNSEPGVHFLMLPKVSEIYWEWVMKISSNWECDQAGCGKLTFKWPSSGGQAYDGIYGKDCGSLMPVGCEPTASPMRMGGQLQWATYGGTPFYPNVKTTWIYRRKWQTYSGYMRKESAPGACDGVWRWWVDGVLNGNLENICTPDENFIQFDYSPTKQRTVTTNQYLRIDHTRVRGR